jgi:HK97 gp10 family phage protein
MDVEFHLTGAEEIHRRLKAVGDEKRVKKLATAAARKGMNVVRDAARRNAKMIDDPQTAEVIAKNIVTANSPRGGRRIGGVWMRVGVMGGANTRSPGQGVAGLPGKDTRHWRYIEFGAENVAAHPFMRPALEANTGKVWATIAATFEREFAKAGA